MMRFNPPITLDGDEAQEQLIQELSKRKYQPTAQDWMGDIVEWFMSLFDNIPIPTEGGAGVLSLIGLLVVLGAIIFAIYKFGAPRLAKRRREGQHSVLFGEEEHRTAQELRTAAKKAAQKEDWVNAVTLQFRAIARRVQERTILEHVPSLTAQTFSHQLAHSFPQYSSQLHHSADSFDEVRYLLRPGTRDDYQLMLTLDQQLDKTKPAQLATITGGAS